MLEVSEMRDLIDNLTGGSLTALNYVCKKNGWEPELIVTDQPEDSRKYVFLAMDDEEQVVYHNIVEAPKNPELDTSLDLWLRVRSIQKTAARVQRGLVRLENGLDPEESVTLH